MNAEKNNYTSKLYQNIQLRAQQKSIFADFGNDKLTYRQLLHSVQKLNAFYQRYDIEQGARIIIVTRHDKHAITLFIASLFAGLSPMLLSVEAKSDRLQAIAEKASARIIFIDAEFQSAWSWLHQYHCVYVVAQSNQSLLAKLLGNKKHSNEQYPALLDAFDVKDPACDTQAQEVAFISLTSGTTSVSKAIITTHRNLFTHLETITRVFGYNPQSRIFNNLSLAHVDGLVQGPLLALYSGALLFRPKSFTIQNLDGLLNTIFSKRITHFITVPTILSLIDRLTLNHDYFEGEDFQCLISVAAKLDQYLWERSQQRFGVKICNMYGLSETVTGGLFCGPDSDTFAVGTVGKPIDIEARIVHGDGSDCVVDEEGELWLRGDSVTPGYLDDPAATASVLTGGWLHTGDMVCQNAEGFIEIVGRKKAMINSGGYNIHPDEINEALMWHPNVTGAATVGISDPDWEELVVSAVETDGLVEEIDLIDHCRDYLEPIKVPKSIVLLQKLPRGISGKVTLSEVRILIENAVQSAARNNILIENSEIIEVAASVFNLHPETLSLKTPSDKIPGWDSLGHLNLITAIEQRFNVQFGVNEMMGIDSLQRLLGVVQVKMKQDEG